ncbi:uncharacterized protein si:ch211-269k10.4 [Phyllopteryx taeniolatus]|uniref:uncharacterized protein si:ch211-269k10.4 n=1 Tax=Phyllopteryx taeniolatus TaxID=161469 RepID=UPI002AD4F5A0|nr:uncharacterized protein si:ch211-269k10.4 [Phyllopteryx taeniolatus]
MACADVKMDIQEDDQGQCQDAQKWPRMVRYQATKFGEDQKGTLTSVLGSLQVVSGLLSVGIGLTFAVSLVMNQFLVTLFRVSHVTGTLFIIAGVVSSMLLRYPVLLTVSLTINRACIFVGLVAVGLISTDLMQWDQKYEQYFKMEVLELLMLGLQLLLTVILCLWISKEKHAQLNN